MSDEIQQQLDHLLAEAKRLVESDASWDDVKDILIRAEELAAGMNRFMGQVRLQITRLQNRRDAQIEAIFSFAEEQLADTNTHAEDIRSELRRAQQIARDEQAVSARVESMMVEVDQREASRLIQAAYHALVEEVDQLWEEGRQQLQTDRSQQDIVDAYFKGAYERAERVANQYDASNPEYERLQHKLNETKQRYDQERDRALMPTTYAALGRFEDLLGELQGIREEEPSRRVEIEDDEGVNRNVPIDQGIQIVERRIGEASRQRVIAPQTGYLDEARRSLQNHDPSTANSKLREAQGLSYLDDDTMGEINRLQRDVDEELSKYGEAKQMAQLALREPDLGVAWQRYLDAQAKYQWEPTVFSTKVVLTERARRDFNNRLNEIKKQAESDRLSASEQKLQELRNEQIFDRILDGLDDYYLEVEKRISIIREEKGKVDDIRIELEQLVNNGNYSEAGERLDEFLNIYPNADSRDTRLNNLARRIRIQVRMQDLPAILKRAYATNDQVLIEQAAQDATEALNNNPNLAQQHGIPELSQQLMGRLRVLQAHEKWLMEEDRQAALNLLNQVVTSPQAASDDKATARTMMRDIQDSERLEHRLHDILPQVHKLLAEEDYLDAYDRMNTMIEGPRVSRDIQREREEVWGKLTDGLIRQTINELELLLQDQTDDLEQLVMLNERLVILGATHTEQLQLRVDEHIAVLRAERSENAREWQQAQDQWKRALDLNQSEPTYHQRFLAARRENYRSELNRLESSSDTLEDALQLVISYIQMMPDYVEPRLWQIDILMIMAGEAKEPRLFDTSWRQVATQYDLTERLSQLQAEALKAVEHEKKARRELGKRREDVENGQFNAHKLLRLERLLRPTQSLTTLRSAVNTMNAFIEENRGYRGISFWWQQQLLPQLINHLETSAHNNAGQYWDAFLDYGRILAIMPDHDEASNQLEEMPQRLPNLIGLIESVLENYHGPTMSASDEAALVSTQIEEVRRVERFVSTALTCRRFFRDEADITEDDLEDDQQLIEKNAQLAAKIQQLQLLDQEYRTALLFAQNRGVVGYWDEYDQQVEKIRNLHHGDYAGHQIMTVLEARKIAVTNRRHDLNQLVNQELVAHFENQSIGNVRRLVDQLDDEDPDDEYRIQRSAVYADPVTGNRLVGLQALREWLHHVEAELEQLRQWLGALIVHDALDDVLKLSNREVQQVLSEGVLEQLNRSSDCTFLNWLFFHDTILEAQRRAARFSAAYDETQAAIDDGRDPQPDMENTGQPYALQRSLDYLSRGRPIERGAVVSQHATLLLQLAQELQLTLQDELSQARRYLRTIEDDARRVINLLNDFDATLQTIAKSARASDIERARQFHAEILAVTPDYNGIYPIEEYPQLDPRANGNT